MSAQITEITAMTMLPALIQLVLLLAPVITDTPETAHTALTLMNVALMHHHTTVLQMEPVLIMTAHSRVLVRRATPEMEQSV
jgi:hypothetical protein